jgi:Glutathione S-transferase, N-terminal domain
MTIGAKGCSLTMILIGQYDSPFVRRVAIALRLYGLPFEHRPWSTFGEGDKIAPFNPLRRVPTLAPLHLALLAGRGRRVAPGEGDSQRSQCENLRPKSLRLPLTRSLRCASASTSPRKRGEVKGLICPTGTPSDSPVQPFPQKYSALPVARNSNISNTSRPHKRGVSRSSRTLGAGCGGRGGVTRRMTRPRTAKPCGPDAPTLASSWRDDSR